MGLFRLLQSALLVDMGDVLLSLCIIKITVNYRCKLRGHGPDFPSKVIFRGTTRLIDYKDNLGLLTHKKKNEGEMGANRVFVGAPIRWTVVLSFVMD